ncbi:MAG: PAS domain S-box protein [Acidimicrobiia bacterium]|nr:PAS domain S-box protein [Acidimicrobiia bacterium]
MTRWNRGARRLYGYDEAAAAGTPVAVLFAEHRRSEGQALVARVLGGEHVERAEVDARRKDRLVVPVWMTMAPLPSGGAVAVVRDVSEQKLAAETLAESEERLRESEVLAHTGAWLWDGSGVVQWSDGMYRIHGVDPRQFDGSLDAHFASVAPDDRRGAEARLLDAYRAGRSFETEYRIRRPNGVDVWVYVRGQPILDAFGRPQGMTGIYQDVSERRRAEQDRQLLSEAELRQMQAREINDEIVQRLVVAQLAFDLGQHDQAHDALASTLETARRLVTGLLGDGPVEPGSLRRSAGAASN